MWLLLLACGVPGDSEGTCLVQTWYEDADHDGWGSGATSACDAPSGYVEAEGDCDDGDATIHPGAEESCDGADQDCDGTPDDDAPLLTQWPDADGDGFGSVSGAEKWCTLQPGWADNPDDCDDIDPAVNPAAAEVCNGFDDDCDTLVDDQDELAEVLVWGEDLDDDGYGNPSVTVAQCLAPSVGWTLDLGDCDDHTASIHPGAEEACRDLVDADCDGFEDDYLGDCVGDPGWVPRFGCDIAPGEVVNCAKGVAAFLPSGATYPTVAAAIAAAAAEDVVTVCPGRWAENLRQSSETLRLAGFGGEVSVLVTGGPGPMLDITGGASTSVYGLGFDGAVSGAIVGGSSELCIESSRFIGNRAQRGGAIYQAGTLSVTDTSFEDNKLSAADYGGAIYMLGTDLAISRSRFTGNAAAYGGALGIINAEHVLLLDNEFEDNSGSVEGGAVAYTTQGPVDIVESTFRANISAQGGGAVSAGQASPQLNVVGSDFEGNSAKFGGAIDFVEQAGGSVQVVDSVFDGNNTDTAGGAVSVTAYGTTTATFEGCRFVSNLAPSGGALSLTSYDSATLEVYFLDSVLTNNTATTSGCCGAAAFDPDEPTQAVLVSDGTDWGAGGLDNTPQDLNGYAWEGVVDFVCSERGCD